jgi:chromate transport protein ChrA
VWFVLALTDPRVAVVSRLVAVGLIVVGWSALVGWWLRGLRPYLRSLVPAALAKLLRSSDARWGLVGIGAAVVCGCAALLWPAAGLSLVVIGYLAQIIGSGTSRQLAIRRRRKAAADQA